MSREQDFCLDGGLIAKFVSDRELNTIALIGRKLPRLVPAVQQVIRGGDGLFGAQSESWLFMTDCAEGGGSLTEVLTLRQGCSQTALKQTLLNLAKIHVFFRNSVEVLRGIGLSPPALLLRDAPSRAVVRDVLSDAAQSAGLYSNDLVWKLSKVVNQRWDNYSDRLRVPLSHTLVHGDFHFDNIVISNGWPTIVDWGSAAIANPCWDLIFCGPQELQSYWCCDGAIGECGEEAFYQDLAAAVCLRVFELLELAVGDLGCLDRIDLIRPALGVCLRNLCKLLDNPFRGGVGFSKCFGS
jgi:hypothetical protein